jgi:hypothetical protein
LGCCAEEEEEEDDDDDKDKEEEESCQGHEVDQSSASSAKVKNE